MNHSEFWKVVDNEFGTAYGQALTRSLALPSLGHKTAAELIEDGENPQKIWLALCEEMDLGEDHMFPHRKEQKKK
ncbi:MAG: DUF3046 domain-containing protein [Flaviflexus sp.]|uniref:DUF3046 domain-containing protein n=1 Tax=Flaviflexus sp. TaxID=1969482 RepID=UPI003F8DB752